jgi:uncharacterized protein (DUF1330 family)
MPAYVIAEIQITNPVRYDDYKKLTPATLAAYGGKFIVRGGRTETLEGNGQPGRIVIAEFPDMESAMRWWNSPEYAAAKLIRLESSTGRLLAVEGVG